jgi:hypothetical protein
MKDLKEDGAAVSAGTGGFTNAAPASGPVAGFDPVMKDKIKRTIKNRIQKRAAPPPIAKGLLSDNH